MSKRDLVILGVLFLLAFGLRVHHLAYPDFKWMDEPNNVAAAINYSTIGQFDPDIWEHPPLRHIILYGFLKIFGDNPYGWRMRTVLGGAVAVVLTYFFALHVTGRKRVAIGAGLLLAVDPLAIVVSRFTFEETYGSALFLAGLMLYLHHERKGWRLLLSALFLGCVLATKWYYLPGWLLICILALREDDNYRDRSSVLFVSSIYVLVPVSVYLLSYYPWFGRGYTLGELVELTMNAYRSLQSLQAEGYDAGLFFLGHTSAAEWFLRPVIVGQGTLLGAARGEFIVFMNNLPVWILTIPALVGMAVLAARKRSLDLALPVLFFVTAFSLFVLVDRPIFIYSAVPLLPFAFTAIVWGLVELEERIGNKHLFQISLSVLLLWSLYLYPFVTAKKVPMAMYRYLLDLGAVKIF